MKQAVVLAAVMLLAACAHDKPRKDPQAAVEPKTAGAPSHHDNIQLPQSQRYAQARDSSPDGDAATLERVAQLQEPVPRDEPRSRYGNGPEYTVRGHRYKVRSSARGYHERGIASWYGRKFHGHLTSSLEPYDMYKFTAAHKTLPLPSYVRVTNLDNGKSVIVRVNDRGPFHANRIIDLSWAAAVRLGIWKTGTGLVDVRAIDPDHPGELSAPDAVTAPGRKTLLYLQVGAYADADNARRMRARLHAIGIAGVRVEKVSAGGRRLSRVQIGPLDNVAAVDRVTRALQKHNIASAQVEIQTSSEE